MSIVIAIVAIVIAVGWIGLYAVVTLLKAIDQYEEETRHEP